MLTGTASFRDAGGAEWGTVGVGGPAGFLLDEVADGPFKAAAAALGGGRLELVGPAVALDGCGSGLARVDDKSATDESGGEVTCAVSIAQVGTCWMSCSTSSSPERVERPEEGSARTGSSSHSSSMSGRLSSVSDRERPSDVGCPAIGRGGSIGGGTRPDVRRSARNERDCERGTTVSSSS